MGSQKIDCELTFKYSIINNKQEISLALMLTTRLMSNDQHPVSLILANRAEKSQIETSKIAFLTADPFVHKFF